MYMFVCVCVCVCVYASEVEPAGLACWSDVGLKQKKNQGDSLVN